MALLSKVKSALRDLASLIWPDQCLVCGSALRRGEKILCTLCRHDMPRCRIHRSDFNPIHQRLMTEGRIDRAAAWFWYHRSSPYTRLIHEAKYHGRPDILEQLGRDFARELIADGDFFHGIDAIIPVPLHPGRLRQRGYNQSYHLALGIAEATGLPIVELLRRTRSHTSQTRRSAFDRWFSTRPTDFIASPTTIHLSDPLHLLLVDDVCTTGATLTACARALHTAYPSARISILTLALASLD